MTDNLQPTTNNVRSKPILREFWSEVVSCKSLVVGHQRKARGFSLVEAVVAAAIIAIGVAGIATAFSEYERAAQGAIPQSQAAFLAEEGIEAAIGMRDTAWTTTIATYTTGTLYGLAWSGAAWSATTTKSEIDGTFYRTITFGSVGRNSSDQIVTSGGTTDTNTRLVTSSVSWRNHNATSTVTLQAYVSNLFNN